jgi:hypothetical protein
MSEQFSRGHSWARVGQGDARPADIVRRKTGDERTEHHTLAVAKFYRCGGSDYLRDLRVVKNNGDHGEIPTDGEKQTQQNGTFIQYMRRPGPVKRADAPGVTP